LIFELFLAERCARLVDQSPQTRRRKRQIAWSYPELAQSAAIALPITPPTAIKPPSPLGRRADFWGIANDEILRSISVTRCPSSICP
jgi:hypothetical protein